MLRRAGAIWSFAIACCLSAVAVQGSGQSALQNYFVGKQVTMQIDMPGTAKGVDLRIGRDDPMDWKQYSSRLKEFGPALRSGDRSTVTTIVVKKNIIEFQLDGGGFGTFWDDDSKRHAVSRREEQLRKTARARYPRHNRPGAQARAPA